MVGGPTPGRRRTSDRFGRSGQGGAQTLKALHLGSSAGTRVLRPPGASSRRRWRASLSAPPTPPLCPGSCRYVLLCRPAFTEVFVVARLAQSPDRGAIQRGATCIEGSRAMRRGRVFETTVWRSQSSCCYSFGLIQTCTPSPRVTCTSPTAIFPFNGTSYWQRQLRAPNNLRRPSSISVE